MLTRQKIILRIFDLVGGRISRTRLVKLAFLFSQGNNLPELSTFYQFVPYLYGPYSFNLEHELGVLISKGYLSVSSRSIQLNGYMEMPCISEGLERELSHFAKHYLQLNSAALKNHVYARFPWFTINAIPKSKRGADRPKAAPAIYTVGYEGLQIDGFLNLLQKRGIEVLVDVRYNPISRVYGFHKSRLSRLCHKIGVRYRHIPELGIPNEMRAALIGANDYRQVFQKYVDEILPKREKELTILSEWTQASPTVLMCMEVDPIFCHRSYLSRSLSEKTKLRSCDLRN
ncbi:MAG: DUF488 domain-containing protein [Deltaproteobacteria bacterium]|nr:DUF488 domain-containing protein [Deltaproteobacteria bacterium]